MTRLPARGKESRTGALVVSGVVAALLCIAIGVFADRWLSTSEVPATGASAPQEAIRASLPAPATVPPEAAPPEATPPEAAPPREPEQPRLAWTEPAPLPVFAQAPEFEEDLVLVPRAAVQAVAGTLPDAGESERPAPVLPASAPDAGAEPAEPAAASDQPATGAAPDREESEACGLISCAPGYSCCNVSCGVCVAPGDDCDPTPCVSKIQYPVSQTCGRSTCSVGEVCCNPSCGTCVAPEESCDPTPCDNAIQYPVSQTCGRSTCSVDEVCCNPSCGTCVAAGETCSQDRCD